MYEIPRKTTILSKTVKRNGIPLAVVGAVRGCPTTGTRHA